MTIEITMPDLATTEDTVLLLEWLVEAGQTVKAGEPLVEIETDKATMEVEAVASGIVVSLHAQAGERVAVGQVIAIIDDGKAAKVAETTPVTAPAEVIAEPQTNGSSAPIRKSSRRVSLFQRNKEARAKRGMFTATDMILLSPVQRETARRLQMSKQTIPHYYLNTSANAQAMINQREASAEPLVWDAFFVKAVALAMQSYQRMRYRFDEDKLVRIGSSAIGVAADIEGDLFVIPVNVPHEKSVVQISSEIRARLERIKAGDASARRLEPTLLTITNLGMENIESFTAVINPPEAGILAVGKIAAVPYIVDGALTIQQRVNMTLAVDHRVVNGRYGAKFLGQIVVELEQSASW